MHEIWDPELQNLIPTHSELNQSKAHQEENQVMEVKRAKAIQIGIKTEEIIIAITRIQIKIQLLILTGIMITREIMIIKGIVITKATAIIKSN